MSKILLLTVLTFLLLMPLGALHAKSPDGVWQRSTIGQPALKQKVQKIQSDTFAYSAQTANLTSLRSRLQNAPKEDEGRGVSFYLPLPTGEYLPLNVFSSPVVAPKLAAKYPLIKSFQVYGTQDDRVSGRIGISSKGLFGYLYTSDGVVVIQPESAFSTDKTASGYRVYLKQSLESHADTSTRAVPDIVHESGESEIILAAQLTQQLNSLSSIGQNVQVYRLAVSLTAEATQFAGGTKERGLEFVVEAVNFLNFIYAREVGIRFELIENNDELIFTNARTDPFNVTAFAHNENHEYLNSAQGIGAENYDIGHVIDSHGGGIATFAQMCNDRHKGKGRSGLGTTGFQIGSAQWVNRLVGVFAHEIGHQIGAQHTQNNNCNRTEDDAWEMHSGSTIMGYAGVCSPSLQTSSDPFLHSGSRERIRTYIARPGLVNCGTIETFNYAPPVINAGDDVFIPTATPFMLTANLESGSSESLTYTWDQMDIGASTSANPGTWKDDGAGPLFRSFAPTEFSTRVFPSMDVVLSDDLNSFSQILPTTEREINFRVTGRSGRGLGQDDVKLNVVGNAGPFQVLNPIGTDFDNSAEVLVQWQVANTDAAPINCSHVDIDLSVDGGANFDQSLVQQTANDGGANVSLPMVAGLPVRLRVKCSDNVFFAVSRASEINQNEGSGTITALPRLDNFNNVINEGTSGATDVIIDIARQNANDQLIIYYAIGFGDPTDERTAGQDDFSDDFEPEGVLVLAIGQKNTTLTLPIRADSEDEFVTEFFALSLSNPSSGNCPRCSFLFTIFDDDEPGDDDNNSDHPVDDELCFPIRAQNGTFIMVCL